MAGMIGGPSDGRISRRRDPLFKSSTALVVNTAGTSLVGMAFWILAARRYSPEVVGASAAVISVMLLLANAAELNLTSAMVRFLPTAGARAKAFVIRSYATVACLAILISAASIPLLRHLLLGRQLIALGPGGTIWFILAVVTWCLFALQDAVAIALRGSVWVPLENATYGLVKLVVLVAVATTAPHLGIFISWTIPMVLTIPAMNLLIFGSLLPAQRRAGGLTEKVSGRHLREFVTFEYFTSLAATAVSTLIQIMVLTRLGAVDNAYFYVVWVTASAFDVALNNLGSSLVAEAARNPDQLGVLTRKLVRHILILLAPVVAVLVIGAPVLLLLFGHTYSVHSSTLLRLLALAVAPRVVIILWMSINRVYRRVGRIFAIQATLGGLLLATSALALHLGTNIDGIGVAYLGCQTIVAIVLLPNLVHLVRSQPRLVRVPTATTMDDSGLSVP